MPAPAHHRLPHSAPHARGAFFSRRHGVLPGFSLALGYSVIYLALIVLIPFMRLALLTLAALGIRAAIEWRSALDDGERCRP